MFPISQRRARNFPASQAIPAGAEKPFQLHDDETAARLEHAHHLLEHRQGSRVMMEGKEAYHDNHFAVRPRQEFGIADQEPGFAGKPLFRLFHHSGGDVDSALMIVFFQYISRILLLPQLTAHPSNGFSLQTSARTTLLPIDRHGLEKAAARAAFSRIDAPAINAEPP